uniref:Uncharacterized protein n=2 Tax=Anguilla anguilla TaxID=7936 RepID=A0A0E9VD40_ANGAN
MHSILMVSVGMLSRVVAMQVVFACLQCKLAPSALSSMMLWCVPSLLMYSTFTAFFP